MGLSFIALGQWEERGLVGKGGGVCLEISVTRHTGAFHGERERAGGLI